MNMSPSEMKNLLLHILSGKEFGVQKSGKYFHPLPASYFTHWVCEFAFIIFIFVPVRSAGNVVSSAVSVQDKSKSSSTKTEVKVASKQGGDIKLVRKCLGLGWFCLSLIAVD